jgi:cell division protein FtsB
MVNGRVAPAAPRAAAPGAAPRVVSAPRRDVRTAPATLARKHPAAQARTRFVFLVIGLLGGGLLCLLLVNTVLATGSFQITALQQQNVELAQQAQVLQASIARQESPAVLAKRARQLGMTEPPLLHFLDLKTNRIASEPSRVRGVLPVPGYTP